LPVGALISMPGSFSNRNWEIKYQQSIDVLDSIGTSIKIGVSLNNVKRILPNLEENYDEWLTNKARFVYDSFSIQRLHYPKLKLLFKFISISWKIAIYMFIYLLYNNSYNIIQSFIGPYSSLELVYNLRSLFNSIGCNNIYYYELSISKCDFRYMYLLNNTIRSLNNILDLLVIGSNIRLEAPLLNSIFRKNYLNFSNFKVYLIGLGLNYYNYPVINIGSSLISLYKYLLGLSIANKYFLFNNYYNLNNFNCNNYFTLNILLGSSSLIRNDFNNVLKSLIYFLKNINMNINNMCILSRHLGKISSMELNSYFNIKKLNKFTKLNKFNFFIGVDNVYFKLKKKKYMNVLVGFFFLFNFFEYINIVLCSSIYVENTFSYLNLEGRYRYTNKVISSTKFIFADYNIIESLNILLKFICVNNFSILKLFTHIISFFSNKFNYILNYLFNLNLLIKYYNLNNNYLLSNYVDCIYICCYELKYSNTLIDKIVYNYYNSDIYSKHSLTLSTMALKINFKNF